MLAWKTLGRIITGCALWLAILAAVRVWLEGLEWYVFAWCAVWCSVVALLGWWIVRVSA